MKASLLLILVTGQRLLLSAVCFASTQGESVAGIPPACKESLLSSPSCKENATATTTAASPNGVVADEQVAPHLAQEVGPCEFSLMKWEDDQSVVDPFAAQVGLPNALVPAIKAFAHQLGIFDIVRDFLYKRPCKPNGGRFYQVENPFASPERKDGELNNRSSSADAKDDMLWYAQRPGSEWQSDMHWLGPADERTHEITIRMLLQGGLSHVLDAIGRHYDHLDGLFVQGVGFLAVSHCETGYMHTDFKNVEGKVFNLLIPVYSPPSAGPELKLSGKKKRRRVSNEQPSDDDRVAIEDDDVTTNIKYDANYGVLVGDGTWHGTRECDHRPDDDVRIVLSIYLADVTEGNIENLSYDDTAIFPVPEVQDWLWAQQGRHWTRKSNTTCSTSSNNDGGRRAFSPVDTSDKCPKLAAEGKCESKPMSTRRKCPKSCEIFMDDSEYQPGVERSKVVGDLDIRAERGERAS